MDERVLGLLRQVAEGTVAPEEAMERLRTVEPREFATIDHDRARRCGVPEVIFAAGKTAEQVVEIAHALIDRSGYALITRALPSHADAVEQTFDRVEHGLRRQTLLVGKPPEAVGKAIPLVTAGTSDEPIAEEAMLTCRALGQRATRINDVGVAGLHRLLGRLEELQQADVVICIAGMEGALPSVLGGLVGAPVLAVPTSVGYGAALGGLAALLGMLTSCASGVAVVNIDNGFGAAYTATLIQRLADRPGAAP
jgi:NCAIR mutase (PurE)-related protein